MADAESARGGASRGLVGNQVEVIASRAEAIAHELNAASAALGSDNGPRPEVTAEQLRAASAALNALAAPTRQLPDLMALG